MYAYNRERNRFVRQVITIALLAGIACGALAWKLI